MAGKSLPASLSPDDLALFQQAVSGVLPIADTGRIAPVVKAVAPIPKSLFNDERPMLVDNLSDHIPWGAEVALGEELKFRRSGVRHDTWHKLRRGHWVLQGELDLHGMVTDEARLAVAGFVAHCCKLDKRCVRIIHGKGLSSKNNTPVLRNHIKSWLMQKDEVLAFCQARQVDGGSGAVVVLLKSIK
ncbi:MAG: DNA mismatch repair protein MutS [Sulfuriferula sp.]|nr:DNA mismatch repair protein MutS [Sulfuriferula sp.]